MFISKQRKRNPVIMRISGKHVAFANTSIQITNYGGSSLNDNNNLYTPFTEYPDVVSVEQLQSMLNIGRNTAYKMLGEGTIKAAKVGRNYIIPKISVLDYLNSIRNGLAQSSVEWYTVLR